jgi:predicted phage tail protein
MNRRVVVASGLIALLSTLGCGGSGGGGNPQPPAAPTNVTAVAGDAQVTVSWTASSGATSYDLYWSTSAGVSKTTGTKVAGAVSGGAVTGLANGTAHYFVVTAVNAGGESAESSPVATATPLPPIPSPPSGVVAVAGAGEVTVSWNASSGATSYTLYYSTSASVSRTTGTPVVGAASGGSVTGLAAGSTYYFVVTAVNMAGESVESAPAASATLVPAAPTGVAAVAGDGQVAVTWTASSDATSYNLYYSTSPAVSASNGTQVAGAASGGAVTGLVNGDTYYFVVTAVNAGGESAESSPAASATPLPPIPSPPTAVAAVAGAGEVTVSWSAPSGATSYNLYYSTSASVSRTTGTPVIGAASGGSVTGLAAGSTYYFVVTAVNLGGESAESSPAASATLIPAAPTGVAAAAGDGQATVSWTASSGATSYDLYWSTSASVSKTTGTKVAGATSGAAIGGLAKGSTYYFVVTAVNAGGESAESSPAASTTLIPAAPTGVAAVAGDGQATVSWTASPGATSYDVYYSTSSSVSKAIGTKVTGATSGGAITGLVKGETYWFVVTAVNTGGESAESSPAASATLVPAPPTGVAVVAGGGQATVSWTASTGATSYDVYWSTSSSVSKATGTKVTGATSGSAVTGLANGSTYYFVVTAVNAAGESAESSPVASTTLIPAPPTGVAAVAGDGQATVSWAASPGAASYDVYYSTSPAVSKATGTKVTGATSGGAVTPLTNGDTYYFVVSAVNAGGESAESSPAASATPLPPVPAPPTGVVASAGDGQVTITWTASSGATSYNLYYSTSSSVSKTTGLKVDTVASGWTVSGLTNGETYYFVVTAVNLGGESAESSPAASATLVPAPPTAVAAVAGDGQATVSWTASTGATSYDVYYSTSSSVSRATGTKVTGATSGGAITGLTNGSTYWFVVTAVNAGGESAESSPAASTTLIPAPPTGVAAVAGDGQATVSWTASTGATSYDVYWSTSSSVSKATGTKVSGATSGGAITGLANGSTYWFVVTAVNAAGESAESTPAASATLVPAPPTGVAAAAGDGQATVSWTASSGATSYDVYWSTSSSVSKATGTTVTGATSGGAITGLTNGTTYYFVVTAVNAGGESAESSPAASATPVQPPPAPPTGVAAVMGVGQATVSWTASPGATSYDVYYSTSASVSKTNGTQVAGATSGGAITGLTAGTPYWFVVTAVGPGGESAESSPAATATPLPVLLGSFTYSGAGNLDMAVDSGRKRVYVSGSIAQSGLIRIDASNPAAMSQVPLSNGSGIAADSATGRYATTNGYGGTLYVYNSNDTLYDTETLSGCPGTMDSDAVTGRFFVSSQCSDHLAVYSQGSASLVANVASNGTGSNVVFDPWTGNVLQNLTPNYAKGYVTAPLVVSPTYSTSTPITGYVRAAGGGRVYVSTDAGDFLVLNGSSWATLHTFPATSVSAVAADTSLGLFYAATGSSIQVYDATTYALVTTLTLPTTGIQNMKMVPGDDRLYAIDGTHLFVIQTRGTGPGPAAPTAVTASAGTAYVKVSWTASAGATSYNLYYSTSRTVSKATGTQVTGVTSGYALTGLTPGTTYYLVVTAVNSSGESVESWPTAMATVLPNVLGKFAYSGAGNVDMAVDSGRKRVYVSGSIAQSGLVRIDASNPLSMSQATLPYGGGIAADSTTGRWATTNGWGATLFVYNSNDTTYGSSVALTGCPGTMDSDPTGGRFFVSSQCSDHIAVYREGTASLVANIASNGVGSNVVYDPSTGRVFQNLTPNYGAGGVTAPLAVTPSYTTSIPFTGYVRAAGNGRIYVSANNGDFQVRDSNAYGVLRTYPATSVSAVAADTTLTQFYASSGATITLYDSNTWAALTSVTLPDTVQNMKMAPGDDRLYVVGGGKLYVIQTR